MKAHFHIQDKIFCCRTNIYFYGEEILCLFGWIETYPGSFGTSSVSPSTAITEFSIFRETRPKISKISEISKDLLKTPISRWSLICPKSPSLHPPEIFAPREGISCTKSVSFHFSVSLLWLLIPLFSMIVFSSFSSSTRGKLLVLTSRIISTLPLDL